MKHRTRYKTRKRYRLTFVNENTFNAVWSVKLSRMKVWILSAAAIAATAALVLAIVLATPVRSLLPGYLRPEQRHQTINNTLRVDSIAVRAAEADAYIANLTRILTDDIELDTAVTASAMTSASGINPDSLIPSSDREREFVRQWEERERFNLTVLTPLAATGMTFVAPVKGALVDTVFTGAINSMRFIAPVKAPVMAIAEGTVVDTYMTDTGHAVTVQHANDFVTRYSGLKDVYVAPGDKLRQGMVMGAAGTALMFEIWHKGTSVNPTEVIPF